MSKVSNVMKSCTLEPPNHVSRRFKKPCKRCSEIFQPVGKYQKLCEKCYSNRYNLKKVHFPTKCFKTASYDKRRFKGIKKSFNKLSSNIKNIKRKDLNTTNTTTNNGK